jgi:hypothetical protein
LQSNEEARP